MAGYGYRVDAVGHPKLPSGSPDPQSVVMLMPLQSPSFQPGHDAGSDSQTQKQLSLGLIACALYYPGVPVIGIGLEQGQSILMYSAQSADVLAVQKGTMSTEDFWARVGSNRTILDARTGKPLSAIDFVNKDSPAGRTWLQYSLPTSSHPPKATYKYDFRPQALTWRPAAKSTSWPRCWMATDKFSRAVV